MDEIFCMKTKVVKGKGSVKNYGRLIIEYGKRAFIITGKNSAEKSGALGDILEVLNSNGISHEIFNGVTENPTFDEVREGTIKAMSYGCDFIIGIGGGSPMDTAKAVAAVYESKGDMSILNQKGEVKALPVVLIPTTAGTGSEVTQYSILSDRKAYKKSSVAAYVYPKLCYLDPDYLKSMSRKVLVDTSIDALSHLLEGYFLSDLECYEAMISEKGLKLFSEIKRDLLEDSMSYESYERLMMMSNLGGTLIANTGTSLPHKLGYELTIHKNISHGRANGMLMAEYMKTCNTLRVKNALLLMGFNEFEEFKHYLKDILMKDNNINFTEQQLKDFTNSCYESAKRINSNITKDIIYNIYKNSIS